VKIANEVLRRFRGGDPGAFADIVREFDAVVRRAASGFFRGAGACEDAMQEVWTHVYKNREALDPSRLDAFPGWLAVMARRRCVDLARLPAHASAAGSPEEEAAVAELLAPPAQEESAEAKELAVAVAAFRKGLRPDWAEFFELHFVQGWDYERVAAKLHISRLRCKYMKKVLAQQASRDRGLREALGRYRQGSADHAR
jgi:RNA polymerase sigma factor (sigma-70 family)